MLKVCRDMGKAPQNQDRAAPKRYRQMPQVPPTKAAHQGYQKCQGVLMLFFESDKVHLKLMLHVRSTLPERHTSFSTWSLPRL